MSSMTLRQQATGLKSAVVILATALLLTGCTGGNRDFDYPEDRPIRRGSF